MKRLILAAALTTGLVLASCQAAQPEQGNIANYRLVKVCPGGVKVYRLDDGGELAIYDGGLWVRLAAEATADTVCEGSMSTDG